MSNSTDLCTFDCVGEPSFYFLKFEGESEQFILFSCEIKLSRNNKSHKITSSYLVIE